MNGSTDPHSDDQPSGEKAPSSRGPLRVIGVVAAVVVAAAVVLILLADSDSAPPPRPDIPLDAWAPYWALDSSLPELAVHSKAIRELSPFWFNAVAAGQIVADPNASPELTEAFMVEARRSDALVVPSIIDAMPAGEMAAVLADPSTRRAHIDTIVEFAAAGDYDGVDIDYEQFAFADGKDSWAATRPNWVAFITELASELHSAGRTLTVSIPPVYDAERTSESGFWVYDYGAIVDHVDHIRIMAYDFSVAEPGPIAPLDWVEGAIEGVIEAAGSPDKLVLGLPAYGRNWPTFVAGECPEEELQGRTSVSARSVDELIERRGATPVRVDATGEWMFEYDLEVTDGELTCIQTRQVHYVDGDGLRLRMDLARKYQLDGVALWALGFDDGAVWNEILPTVADPQATTTVE
ncbi:MAG: hypothetical protein KUG57_00240 [Ilumatobacteraceae bacterium]|nr:hypothetical protein [Ilumatobacteraceae bacterium]